VRDILKELNDRNPSEVRALDDLGLRRFEALCESWAKIAEAELARRNMLPRSRLRPELRDSTVGTSSAGPPH
jgi:hypothetical protein